MTAPDGRDYYEILQVDSRADPEVIHAAYLRLAKKYHPDISREPDAAQRMKEINAAYEVLSDPSRRREYDATAPRRYGAPEDITPTARPSGPPPSEEAPQGVFVGCQVCGRIDASVRLSAFLWVISLVLVSWRRGTAGIWCGRHRGIEAAKWTALSLLLGPWGVPFGIFWTIQALVTNGLGGRQPADVNAALLRSVAGHLVERADYVEAAEALASSLKLEYYEAGAQVLGALLHEYPSAAPRVQKAKARQWALSPPFAASLLAVAIPVGVVAALVVANLPAGGASGTRSPSSPGVSSARPVAKSTPSQAPQAVLCEEQTVYVYPWDTEKNAVLDHYNFVIDRNNRMVEAADRWQAATAAVAGYDDAILSPQFVAASDTYISALEAALAELRSGQSVPEGARTFDAALRRYWELQLAAVQKLRDGATFRSPSVWNEGVDLVDQVMAYEPAFEEEARAICDSLAD